MIKKLLLSLIIILYLFTGIGHAGIAFDGIDDKVTISDDATLDTDELSISLWAFIDPVDFNGAVKALLDKSNFAPGSNNGFFLAVDDRGGANATEGLFLQVATPAVATARGLQVDNAFPAADWYHIVVTYASSGTIKIYIDSVDTAGTDRGLGTGNIDGNNFNLVIAETTGGGSNLKITITELAIWDGVLTQADVDLLFGQIKRMPLQRQPSNLAMYLSIDDGPDGTSANGDNLADMSINSNNGTGDDGPNNTGLTWQAEEILTYP